MMWTINPNMCACSNYVKREGEIFKVMCEQSEDDSNMMGETEVNNNQTQNPEEVIMQIDGSVDSFNEDEVTDATESDSEDDDVSRPNILSTTWITCLKLRQYHHCLHRGSPPHRTIWTRCPNLKLLLYRFA